MATLLPVLGALLFLLQAAHGQPRACPDVCSCIGATRTMDCTPRPDLTGTDVRFTSIPQSGPLNTRVIIMTGNLLSSLAPGIFSPYPSLETIVLNDNLFTDVPSEGFYNLSITNLTFDGNPLTGLGSAAFSNLTSLQHLSIRRTTTLASLDGSEVFQGLDNLLSLSLDDNLLRSLPAGFLSATSQLRTLSLRNNSLQTLAEDFFAPIVLSTMQIDLSLNPWSCDCFLQWLRSTLDGTDILADDMETVCHWPPPYNNPRTRISQVPAADYQCYEPTITINAPNATLLSNTSLTIPCGLNSAPFPAVTWTKDGVAVSFTLRVHIALYDATLRFESQGVEDSGEYQCMLANANGTTESRPATITVFEATCFDNSLTMFHETGLDCGGPFCTPCNITMGCLLNRDCIGELVCLYGHSLPSSLHYISPSNPDAYTCAASAVPALLLEAIFQSKLPLDISLANVSAEADTATLLGAVQDLLALQLEVARSTLSNLRVTTIEKIAQPLIQVWFDLRKGSSGEQADSKLIQQINDGNLKATAKRTEGENFISYRLNL